MAEKYSRLSHRKTDAKTRGEQLEHVRSARSQARDSTLDYFAALHALNQKRSYLFLEPLLGYLRAFVVATRASADAIAKRDVETNLTVFDEFVKSEHRDLTADQRRLEARIDAMRAQQQAEAVAARSHASEGISLARCLRVLYLMHLCVHVTSYSVVTEEFHCSVREIQH